MLVSEGLRHMKPFVLGHVTFFWKRLKWLKRKVGEVLHAIVDCVWLSRFQEPPKRCSNSRQHRSFAQRVTDQIGIPLEYEQFYEFIAFLPSRMHGAGSLTKYWAFDGTEYKVRGIELRQHSTPSWIRSPPTAVIGFALSAGTRINGRPGPFSPTRCPFASTVVTYLNFMSETFHQFRGSSRDV